MKTARNGRYCVVTLFCINGFVTGSWAVQIAQLVPRFNVTDLVVEYMILIFGLGALSMMPLTGFLMPKFGSQRIFSLIASAALAIMLLVIFLLAPFIRGAEFTTFHPAN